MNIQIWSDVVCPFCYIGKRHFEKALQQFEHAGEVQVEWLSFQLDPDLQASNESIYEYLASRKGISVQQSKAMHEQVTQMAARTGLTYNFDKAILANTFAAHCLIQLAKEKGLGDAMEECLFSAYFTEGKNLEDENTLIELGGKTGLSENEVKDALGNKAYATKVGNDIQMAQQIGVHGVPFFIFNNAFAVSGAQPPEIFLQTLNKAFSEWKKTQPVHPDLNEGPSCGPDSDYC